MYPPLNRSASLTTPSLSVFILADAIALVLAGMDKRKSRCLLLRHSYTLHHIPDDSIMTLGLLPATLLNYSVSLPFRQERLPVDSSCEHPFPQTYS
jgi:hypothetical protein